LRDLSRTSEIGRIELMTALLPERVGSPFSVNALRGDLEVAYDTVTRWLKSEGCRVEVQLGLEIPPRESVGAGLASSQWIA
jgi:hypothetical protein